MTQASGTQASGSHGVAAPPCAATLATAAAAGLGVMAVELAAVRLLAPWFGTSAAVWTNVIGVILLALSLGYLLGARCAAGPRPAARLCSLLACGAALVLLLPFAAGPVAGLFLPAGLTLDRAAELSTWGSLASAGLLFLAPAVLLGAVGPLAVELVQQRTGAHAGTAGGQVLCVSTLGSLVGTFGTTHLLLPGVGTRTTFLAAGTLLFLAATGLLLASAAGRRAPAVWIAWLALPPAAWLPAGVPAVEPPWRLLAEAESPYQRLRVIETGQGDERLRLLQVNEGLDSFQSVWRPEPGLLGQGYYYDYLALPLSWPGPERRRVLVLGLGAGTVFRVLEGLAGEAELPAVELVGVELDPEVIALGRAWFDLGPDLPERRVVRGDARVVARALGTQAARFDLVVLDCYANQSEIPAHLATLDFFEELRELLAPEGCLALNVGGFGADDPVVGAVGGTLAEAFDGRVVGVRVPSSRNWILYAFAGQVVAPQAGPGAGGEPSGPLASLLPPLGLPGAVVRFDPAAPDELLTDDRAPLAELQRRSLQEGQARLAGDA